MNQLIEVYDYPDVNMLTLQRYYVAAPYCIGQSVLEVGCNTGYGTSIISGVAKTVVAYDHEPRCICFAKKYWARENILYDVFDVLALPTGEFDRVVALEVLEHIPLQFEVTISLLLKHVSAGGILIISVPIGENAEPNETHCHTRIKIHDIVSATIGAKIENIIYQGDPQIHPAAYSQAEFFIRKAQ